jgi:glucose-1-phosphate cytidylyltransferase
MKVVILAGGMGSRLSEETEIKPKPMVEIGGKPIIWHIMKIYATFGFTEFILALGYKGELIKDYFLNYYNYNSDLTVHLKKGGVCADSRHTEDWMVQLVDTGLETGTGGRLKRLAPLLGDQSFLMTYGDGVSNVDLDQLVAFHKKQKKVATLTAVRPPARFGGLEFQGDLVSRFSEKSQIDEGWINGGFCVLEPEVLQYIENDTIMFERQPLENLAAQRKLAAFRHEGFWQCMDTVRDVRLLNSLWASGDVPWKVW